MIKRLVAGLLAAAVGFMQLLPPLSVIAYADNSGAVISASSVTGRQGETVEVELSISNNPGINAFGIQVTYDTAALECTGIAYGDSLKNAADPLEMPPADMKASPFRVGWAGGNKSSRFNGNEAFLTLKFKITETAPIGDYPVTLSQKTPGETARYEDSGSVSPVPVNFAGGNIRVTDEKREYTGAVPSAPTVSNIGRDSFEVTVPPGSEYTYSASPITDFSACVWHTETVASPLLPNTEYYVYLRVAETDTTLASPASEAAVIRTDKYDISDVIESVSIGDNGTEGTVLTPAITYKNGFDENSLDSISYNWQWLGASLSVSDKYFITADDAKSGREIYLTISADNCNGEIRSNTVTAQANAPTVPELAGINVNGMSIAGFSSEKLDYEYQISYESWSREPGKVYTVDPLSNGMESAEVSDNGFSLNIADPDISALKSITITVTAAGGQQRVYTVKFIVEKCPHAVQTENISLEPTCTELGKRETVCGLCNKILGSEDIPASGHEFDDGIITAQPDCVNEGVITYSCQSCGESYTSSIPVTGHNWSETVTDATCTTDGAITNSCTLCGAVGSETVIPAFGHSFGAWTRADDTTYVRECTVCGATESKTVSDTSHEHIFDGRREITRQPTCRSVGEQNVYCSVEGCGEYVPEEIEKAPHTPGEAEVEAPTCTAAGSSTVSCTDCGAVISQAALPAFGHSFTDYVDTAACTLPGVKEAQCDNGCGAVDSIPSPAKGHSYDSDWHSGSAGHWHLCTVCGNSGAVLGHTENSGIVTLQPTSTAEGIKTYSCTVCGYVTKTETIPVEPTPVDPTPVEPTPIEPTPIEPTPVEPTPIEPTPVEPTPVEPTPVEPTPVEPTPVEPTPVEPTPVEPTPVEPTPGNPTPPHSYPVNPPIGSAGIKEEGAAPVTVPDSSINVTFNSELTEPVNSGVRVRTNHRYFEHSAEIRISNTSDSEAAAKRALARLDGDGLIYYAFDISIYNTGDGSKMQLVRNGHITFEIPVPQSMEATVGSIEVYHIPGGVPERIESEVKTDEKGNMKIVFTATKFSPYMFTAAAAEDISAGAGMAASAASDDLAPPAPGGAVIPKNRLRRVTARSGRKRRYRILRKRRIDELVFVY